jgi:hypothetical protein
MRPSVGDYGAYYQTYIDLVEGEDHLAALASEAERTQEILRGVPEERGGHRYAVGKWSLKEVLGHILDCERIFTMRALCIARGESQSLPGFEQDDYVAQGGFDGLAVTDLASQLGHQRTGTLDVFASLDAASLDRRGTANDQPLTPRAVAFILVGHERHHVDVLQRRYL